MTSAITRFQDTPLSLDLVIAAWITAKGDRSHSADTKKAYTRTIAAFRRFLVANGLDLDSDERKLTIAAQAWAREPWQRRREVVSSATYNQRLAIVSSFYRFARRYGLTVGGSAIGNPVANVERGKVKAYAGAHAIPAEDARAMLARIDRSTPAGRRDFALLAVALQTGRRLAELAHIKLADLSRHGDVITVDFPRTKGGDSISDKLTPGVTRILEDWIAYRQATYGDAGDGYLWLNLSRYRNGRPLGVRSISDVCLRWLGTSKVHTTRHTFAHEMRRQGADYMQVQQRLQHKSPATTMIYLAELTASENAKANEIATAFGFED